MAVRVLIKLKDDIETQSEIFLAKQELSRLCGDTYVWEVGGDVVARDFIGLDTRLVAQEARFLCTENVARNLVDRLRRLAYAEWFLVEGEIVQRPQQAVLEETNGKNGKKAVNSSQSRRHREYLGHGIHKYKAKFFPRFARSLLNITCPRKVGTVLDPFCGSGTTILEAALMGLEAIGNDLDPLSCLISQAKVDFATTPIEDLRVVERMCIEFARKNKSALYQPSLFDRTVERKTYRLPEFLQEKITPQTIQGIEHDTANVLTAITGLEPSRQSLALLILSHALATKVSFRWMGTGDYRFSLDVNRRRISDIMLQHVRRLISNHPSVTNFVLSDTSQQALNYVKIINYPAQALPLEGATIDAIVTSPPYLPATSGRETYLKSRAPSLVALGLLSEETIQTIDRMQMMGSVLRQTNNPDGITIPDEVVDLASWMQPQRARAPKAVPTLEYFYDLYRAGKEMYRLLKTGGMLAIVIATNHTFYELTSREVVRVFPFARILEDFFTNSRYGIGFIHFDSIELELPKQDYAARPASKHGYSETAVILRKP